MEIEIYNPSKGELLPPVRWNYEELKKSLTEALENYKGLIYTEDTINQAKKDRAGLNKLADAIDARRKEMKARYLSPYEEFEAQAKELTALVKRQASEIDAQVKAFEDAKKAEKLEHIKAKYTEIMADLVALVPYEKIHNKKWLNVTVKMSSIEAEIVEKAESIRAALASIDALGLPEDMAGRVKSVYLASLDLAAALAEKERIEREQQALADYEAAKMQAAAKSIMHGVSAAAQIPMEALGYAADEAPDLMTVDFRIYATREQLAALKSFLIDNGIKYGRVPTK